MLYLVNHVPVCCLLFLRLGIFRVPNTKDFCVFLKIKTSLHIILELLYTFFRKPCNTSILHSHYTLSYMQQFLLTSWLGDIIYCSVLFKISIISSSRHQSNKRLHSTPLLIKISRFYYPFWHRTLWKFSASPKLFLLNS